MAFAVAAEAEKFDRELERWGATWDRLEAIQKQLRALAKAFSK